MNLNEIFEENGTSDDLKMSQKTEFHPLSRKYIFGKT